MNRKSMAAALILCAAVTGVTGTAHAGTGAGVAAERVNVLLVDRDGGQREWTGSKAEADRMIAGLASATADREAVGGQEVPGDVHAAIHRVPQAECNRRTDFWVVWNYPPKVCFASPGGIGVRITSVYAVDSGNNTGGFNWSYAGKNYSTNINVKYHRVAFTNFRVTVTHVRLT